MTADHVIAEAEDSRSSSGDKDALIVYDRATRFRACYPLPSKSAEHAAQALKKFLHESPCRLLHTDSSPELASSARTLGAPHAVSPPGRPRANGVVERQVRHICEGARSIFHQAGLPEKFWNFAAQHFAHSCNVTLGKPFNAAWAARHGEEWSAPLYPFGCIVHVMPNEAAGTALPNFAPKSVPAVFLFWYFQP